LTTRYRHTLNVFPSSVWNGNRFRDWKIFLFVVYIFIIPILMRIHILNSSNNTTTFTCMKNWKILNLINDKWRTMIMAEKILILQTIISLLNNFPLSFSKPLNIFASRYFMLYRRFITNIGIYSACMNEYKYPTWPLLLLYIGIHISHIYRWCGKWLSITYIQHSGYITRNLIDSSCKYIYSNELQSIFNCIYRLTPNIFKSYTIISWLKIFGGIIKKIIFYFQK